MNWQLNENHHHYLRLNETLDNTDAAASTITITLIQMNCFTWAPAFDLNCRNASHSRGEMAHFRVRYIAKNKMRPRNSQYRKCQTNEINEMKKEDVMTSTMAIAPMLISLWYIMRQHCYGALFTRGLSSEWNERYNRMIDGTKLKKTATTTITKSGQIVQLIDRNRQTSRQPSCMVYHGVKRQICVQLNISTKAKHTLTLLFSWHIHFIWSALLHVMKPKKV